MRSERLMKETLEQMLALQKLQFDNRTRKPAPQAELDALRQKLPGPILQHYERHVMRGKKAVAMARAGVCSECHLRITVGKLARLGDTDQIHRCDNCGRYLHLPAGEPIGLSGQKRVLAVPSRQPSPTAVGSVI